MGTHLVALLSFVLVLVLQTVQCATPSVARCPRYVEEGDTLTCTCTPGDCTNSQITVTWLNQSPASDTLVQTNVRREDNGTQFTCQMVCGGETSTVTYVLQVGYGPSENRVSIVGNQTFITNGSRLLTLTCGATEVNPVPVFRWLDPLCQANSQGSTCSFTPQIPWDDGKIFRCRVSDDFRVTPQVVVKEVTSVLKYPPFDAPVISGYTPGQIVKTGDNLTCTVTGGKPLVDRVYFYCSSHVYADIQHATQGTSVSSSLTIDVTNVTKETENVTCHCSGYWAPEDDLYTLNTDIILHTEHPPFIVNFTVNGYFTKTLTVNESDHTRVTLQSSAYGRPAPRVYLMKNGTQEIASNGVPDKLEFSQVVPYRLDPAECEHMGNYTGVVNVDKQIDSDQKTIRLEVTCAPRLPKNVSSNMDRCPPAITENGFNLLVVANPSPHNVTVEYLGVTQDKDIMAFLSINQRHISPCETRIEVRVTKFTELPDGEYRLSVSNTLGSFNCSFPRMKKKDPHSANIGAIAGGTAAALVVIIIIIACCFRRKPKDQDKENVDAKHNEGVVNPKFVEDGSGLESNHDNDRGIEMNGGSSPLEMSPRQSDGAGYASLSDYPPSGQHSGEFRKKSGRAAAYEVTSITSTGKVNIKTAAPQPNAYQDPWDIKKGDMTLAGAPGGPPTLHNVGPKGDEYAMISNAKNKTTIAVGPQGAKHGKGDNTQGSPAKAQDT